jgi:Zn finger protein HypA/HybF involved in hydrogenase expression
MPRFRPQSLQFEKVFAEEVIARWAEIGLLQVVWRDQVQTCPRCHGLPSFRVGCVNCGSAILVNDTLIHHFACAHVGLASDFERGTGELICPKCHQRPLIVGTDFEYATGPYRCLDCSWSDTEREQVAQCLRCSYRFPVGQAHVVELRGYRAQQLDILALLPAHQPTVDVPPGTAAD